MQDILKMVLKKAHILTNHNNGEKSLVSWVLEISESHGGEHRHRKPMERYSPFPIYF